MRTPRVAIVGAGLSGLGMAAAMQAAGMTDFTIYEKADRVGGTWRENRYPGLTCDVPSRFYQYSFAKSADWSQVFADGAEIERYIEDFAHARGLEPHIRFGTEVTDARWGDGRWHLGCADGTTDEADVLVTATGVLHHPRMPDIPGIADFAGDAFHSARWKESVPIAGRRVAVIGTGSTGVQITGALAGVAGRVLAFQRSRHWVMTAPNHRYSRRWRSLLRRFPRLRDAIYDLQHKVLWDGLTQAVVTDGLRRRGWQAAVRLNLRLGVRDPRLRAKLTPDYPPLCKRLILSPNWYRAIQDPSVELVTDGIERIEPAGIRTRDGRLHEVDVIVFATGFDAHAFMRPMSIVGADGVTLEQAWADGPRAYRTVALPGFPNLFTLQGPHSPVGNYSLIAIAETQIGWIMQWLELMRAGTVASVMPTEPATAAYYTALYAAVPDTVWSTGCRSWYHGPDGRPEIWPWTAERHRELLAEPVPGDFHIERTGRSLRTSGGVAPRARR